jgi:4-alpha-glucanotransferase
MTEGVAKLPGLKRATNMLICGEDLGMVPACVPEALRRLGLLSLEVQRMPKTLNARFSQPAHAPYLSVVTPSTHDMSTVRGWWTEDRESTQAFFHGELGLPGTTPETCETWVNRLIIKQHLASPAMWSIFQLQDLLGSSELRWPAADDERINVPANPKHYWRYRMHLRLEELLEAESFNRELREMISSAGR